MTTMLPSNPPTFTLEQRRMLGQVYNLILSWRKEKMNLKPTSSEATESQTEETVRPDSSQGGGSDD
ncbi:MAG: hypothetical protein AABZ00_10750 [Chloroflexota bacterium]